MRIVSYTRAMSCRPKDKNPENIIGIQNDHIEGYLKSHGLRLSAKYSDRKFLAEEASGFDRMVEDGLNRCFDCVVTDSIFRFGRGVMEASNILLQSFYPAGIHFIIVEDDFASTGKSQQELEDYFNRKRIRLASDASWDRWRELEKEGVMVKAHLSYGYLLSEDRRRMVIDESVEPVIRRIFEMFLSGMGYTAIADQLNREGIMSPQEHMTRVFGKEPDFIVDSIWRGGTIHKMLLKPIYMGKAVRKVGGVDTVIDVPPIISEDVFLQVQKLAVPRQITRTWKTGNANLLNKRIYDKESGRTLMCLKSPYDENERMFTLKKRFRYLSKKDKENCIPYHVVMEEIRNTLIKERMIVEQVDGFLKTEEAKICLEAEKKEFREQARKILLEINSIYEERLESYRQHENGQLSEEKLHEKEEACQMELIKCEQKFKQVMAQVEEKEIIYSRINPWLALYRGIEVPEELGRKHIKDWIGIVTVDHFRTVEVGLKEQEWKAKLPKEWIMTRGEG